MASDFPLTVTAEIEHGSEVHEFVPSQTAGETAAKPGELMYIDTAASNVAKRCGADPGLIAGVAEVASEAARVLTPDGRIPIRLLKPNALVRMCSATTPVQATHVGNGYGIARLASGNWALDISDTSNIRAIVKKVDEAAGAFFVSFIAANLQFDAIAS